MARDDLFAGLCFLGCVNGMASPVIKSITGSRWTNALLDGFDTSAIAWFACGAGLLFIWREKRETIQPADIFVAVGSLILIILPTAATSWLAVMGLSLYMLVFTNVPVSRRCGAVILLATTVPMLWSRLAFHFFANPILNIDAGLVAWVLGTGRIGNMVRFVDGSDYMIIMPACSSLVNASYAFLCWVVISQVTGRRWSPRDLLWCLPACAAMITVNVARLSLMGFNLGYYRAIHSQWGDVTVNMIGLGLAVGISLLGVRHELSAHA